jgi:hypothetical protein
MLSNIALNRVCLEFYVSEMKHLLSLGLVVFACLCHPNVLFSFVVIDTPYSEVAGSPPPPTRPRLQNAKTPGDIMPPGVLAYRACRMSQCLVVGPDA